MGWSRMMALAILMPLASVATGQTIAPDSPVVERKPAGCAYDCTALVNRNLLSRVVVTLEVTPAPSWSMYDRFGNTVNFAQTTIPVLLQAGERRILSDSIITDITATTPPTIKKVQIDYRVAGYYNPKPDLRDLPAGVAEDFARFFQQWNHGLDGSAACGSGHPEGRILFARNMNPYRSLAVAFQNKRPGSNNALQTIYLRPGQESPIGCVSDWPVLTVEVRFSS